MRRAKKRILIILGVVSISLACLLAVWAIQTVYYFQVDLPKEIKTRQHFILTGANHQQILDDCRAMMASPAKHPQLGGDAFPQNLPPYLAGLDAAEIRIYHDGVLISFDRTFGLWVTPAGASGPPELPTPYSNRELIPGLYYFEYH